MVDDALGALGEGEVGGDVGYRNFFARQDSAGGVDVVGEGLFVKIVVRIWAAVMVDALSLRQYLQTRCLVRSEPTDVSGKTAE